ncbi:TPA: cellulose biosynthesis cyclic di-GMP-binding regulatory protein BcsB [Klebsiella pneumoniae]
MKRLTTLALLAGMLSAPALHSEEPGSGSAAPLSFPQLNDAADSEPGDEPPAASPEEGASPAAPATAGDAAATAPAPVMPDLPPPVSGTAAPEVIPVAPVWGGDLNLAQMGMPDGIILSGGQRQGGVSFTLPADQVVIHSQLSLAVRVSPEMASRNTTLQLMLNGQPLGTLPLGADGEDVSHYQLDIPPALMVSSNNLSVKINDGDTLQCQRDIHDTSRVTVLPTSHFSWESQQLNISDDLSHFPRPFFDSMQMTPADIAVAYGAKPSADVFSAAALISSWLGIQADYRGIAFSALRDRLPERHGIVIGHPGEQVGGMMLPETDKPLLSVTLNGTFLNNLPMNKQGPLEKVWRYLGGDARQERFTIPLAPYLIYGDNQLSMYFNVVPKDDVPCSVLLNNNIKSRITDDSWIDLSKTRHFSLLPNLSYFVGASFPFSRLADYSQTTLLLPADPSETQVATLLNLAARSGNATGTALANNRVVLGMPTGGGDLQSLRERDVLAVTALDQQAFNQSLLADSPYRPVDNVLSVREPDLWQKVQRRLTGDWTSASLDADRYFSSSSAWRGFISYRSPWNSTRLVVVALASNDDQLARLKTDLESPRINAGIRGDTAVITSDNGVRSFQVSTPFPSGQMPWYMMAVWYASQHSGFLAVLGLIATSIMGLALTAMFKRHARKRLGSGDNQ